MPQPPDHTPPAPPRRGPYHPAWWIPGPHLRTLWGKFVRRRPTVPARDERWETPDGDFIDLHRLDPADPPGVAARPAPRLIVLHGLEGSARSHYARGLFAQARQRGWAADVLIFRSCGPELNRLLRSYHSGDTGDIGFLVRRLVEQEPDRPIVLAGVSLGGNVLLKWLGEQADRVPAQVVAAAAVSVPYDLARGARHLQRGLSHLYELHFLRTLRRKAIAKGRRFPGCFEEREVARTRTLWEFDDLVTAPIHGFRDAADYYARSSSINFLPRIRVPTLLLNAVDDPFLPAAVLDDVRAVARENPTLHLEFPARGGHVGFIGGRVPWRPFYYAEWRVTEFLAVQASAAR